MEKSAKFGFTLIELVLTITLMTILSFVIITKFSFEPAILNVTGTKLMSDIRYAQSLAVNRGGRYGIKFVPRSDKYCIYENAPTTPCDKDDDTLVPDPKNPAKDYIVDYRDPKNKEHSGVDLVKTTNFGSDRLEFDWKGVPYAGSGSALTSYGYVTIKNPYTECYIIVEAQTGMVTYQCEKPGGGGCAGACSLIRKK